MSLGITTFSADPEPWLEIRKAIQEHGWFSPRDGRHWHDLYKRPFPYARGRVGCLNTEGEIWELGFSGLKNERRILELAELLAYRFTVDVHVTRWSVEMSTYAGGGAADGGI